MPDIDNINRNFMFFYDLKKKFITGGLWTREGEKKGKTWWAKRDNDDK